jgi:hypothetical protein
MRRQRFRNATTKPLEPIMLTFNVLKFFFIRAFTFAAE